jgi:hypothetical protein
MSYKSSEVYRGLQKLRKSPICFLKQKGFAKRAFKARKILLINQGVTEGQGS